MKIYTVTFLGSNYGSILQAFALQKCIKDFGGNPVIIREKRRNIPSILKKSYSYLMLLKPKKNYSLSQRIQLLRGKNKFEAKYYKLNRFIEENIITEEIQSRKDFMDKVDPGDIFLAGSDQIWSTLNNELSDWYTFQWVSEEFKKFSYAASVGQSTLSDSQIRAYVHGLSDFEHISFREAPPVKALSSYLQGKLRQDLDPTLLLNRDVWQQMESPRKVEEPYVFVYMLRPMPEIIELAKRIAKEKGWKIIYTGNYAYQFEGVETIFDAGIEDFLSYIDHAKAVVTNSFHGTAFSVIFEKPFLSCKIASTSSRVESLLSLTGLTSQYVTDINEKYSLAIDYSKARKKLDAKRKESFNYLQRICKQ